MPAVTVAEAVARLDPLRAALAATDAAMYRAKNAGRNRVCSVAAAD